MILHLQGRENLISWLCAPSFLAICYRLRTQSSTISSAPVHEESYHCAFINEEPPRAPESIIIEGFSKVFIPFGHWFWGQMVVLDNYVDKMQSILWYLTHIFRKFHWDLFIMATATASNVIRGQIQILRGFISLIWLQTSFSNLCLGLRDLICIT